MNDKKFHPLAELFPLMQDEELASLKTDIAQNGLRESIWLHPDGSIIDGRNRYLACKELNLDPSYRIWSNNEPLINFIISLNLHRRHLTSSQRAVIALDIELLLAKEAKKRQATSTGGASPQLVEKIPQAEKGKARDRAAKLMNTNSSYVSRAKRLKQEAPQLFEQVKAGELSLSNVNFKKMKPKRNTYTDRAQANPLDHCQTPAYGLESLLPYLNLDWVIWESASGEGLLQKALQDAGCKEVIGTDILNGQNFFEQQPINWDCQVTNPPYSIKYDWLEKSFELGKPFALLLPVEILGTQRAQNVLKKYRDFGILLLNRRIDFKMPQKGWQSSAQFPVFWLCWQLLSERIVFGEVNK